MIEALENIDKSLFELINSFHSHFFDSLMWWISYKYTWIPLYAVLLYFAIKHEKGKNIWLLLLMLLVTVVLTDQISVMLKNFFGRYRPCHNEILKHSVHLVKNHCGGLYGFVSSHAANSFGIAVFLSFLFANKKVTAILLVWAVIISYSRIYLGVHYPADIAGGALLGIITGSITFAVYSRIKRNIS